MKQDKAVKKMMLDIRLNTEIPETALNPIRRALYLMWQVGWEDGRKDIYGGFNKYTTAVLQLDEKGRLLREHPSVKVAAARLNCAKTTIFCALKSGQLTKKRHYWKRKIEELNGA